MLAGWTGRRPQNAQGNGRFRYFIAHDQPAVCPDYRLALKIGQFPVAWRPFEVIAHEAVLLAHIARPVQLLDADVIRRLLVKGSPGVGARGHRPDDHGKEYRRRLPKPL